MATGINPKIDCVFKAVFGAEENKDVLIHLLNAVLDLEDEGRIADVEILNPYNDATFQGGKQSVVDLKAKDEQGKTYQVEMQMRIHPDIHERMLWNWSDIHHRQLNKSEDYTLLKPTICIWFLNETLFKSVLDQFHHQFGIFEKTRHELFSPQFNLQVIEMEKWTSSLKTESDLDAWLKFLNYGGELDPDQLPDDLQIPEIRKAMKTLERFSQSDKEHDLYVQRLEYLRVENSWKSATEKAEAEAQKYREALIKAGIDPDSIT
jgi:predicted transposase/invertase (TIGR01784 family)